MKLSDKDIKDLKETYPNISEDVIELNSNRKPIQQAVVNVQPIKKRSKYNATPTEFNGRLYPSKTHARHAEMFYLQLRQGLIKGVLEEIPFRLPGKTKTGKPVKHYVDWGIIGLDDKVAWYESKGKDLELGRLKRAQVEDIYHISIKIL